MTKTKLALAIAGAALSVGATSASASTTMYNTFTTPATTATDGWTHVAADANGYASGKASYGNSGLIVPWAGPTANKLPFDYVGSSHLNWAVQLTGQGDTAEISGADSMARYGFDAEIDTGGGAWRDNVTPTGWKHQTDIGLIQSDVTQQVHINLVTLGNLTPATFSTFGVTVFDGMDTNTGNYSHHGSWNNATKPYTNDNPFGTTGLINMGYSDHVDGTTDFTFTAVAGHIYSLYLGGVDFSKWNTGVDSYKLTITTSAPAAVVPVPGAIWLFGSAVAGMIGFGRRKVSVAA